MSTNIVPFNFNDHQVRVITIDGEPWFVLADLCAVLSIGNPSEVNRRVRESLGDAALSLTEVRSGGQRRQATIVSEAGMYEVVIRSDKPEAVAFRRWITAEVLPQIRKTGTYSVGPSIETAPHRAPEVLSIKEQAAVLRTLRSALQPDYADAKARILLARAMNEEPEIDPAKRPLDVQSYLESRGVSEDAIKSRRSHFGTIASRLYLEAYGERPKKVDRIINGTVKKVSGYTEEHRHILDRAFDQDRVLSTLHTNELDLGSL